MALLRASADAVVIGAGNLRATPGHQWTPAAVAGDDAAAVDAYRFERTGATEPPSLVVVSASGDLPAHVALDQPGDQRRGGHLECRRGPRFVPRIRARLSSRRTSDGGVSGAGVVAAVTAAMGPGLLLCEGGPSLFGRLLADGAVQELFLTISPRVAGRDHEEPRPGIVDGWAAAPRALLRAAVASVRRSDDHLFLRYRLAGLSSASGGRHPPGHRRSTDRSHRRRDWRTGATRGCSGGSESRRR